MATLAQKKPNKTFLRLALIVTIFAALFITTLAIAVLNQTVFAATGTNQTINFQGKVTNTDGTNVTDGDYSFTFKIYSVSTLGAAIWTETKTLTVTDGIFQTALGDTTTLPGSVDFNTDNIYLGIEFNGDGEMEPRVRFTSVPQALNALKVAGLTVTDTTGTLTIPNSTTVQFAGAFTTSGANALTLTTTDTTTLTLPTAGTLATLAGTEVFTNKTFTDNLNAFSYNGDVTTLLKFDVANVGTGTTLTLALPASPGTSDTICLQTKANCGGSGSSVWSDLTAPTTSLTLAFDDGEVSTFNSSSDTETLLTLTGNSLTSGKILSLNSTAAASFTGSLLDVNLSDGTGASSNTGSLATLTNSGTANANTSLYIKHYATGTNNLAFRIDDVASDTTPFVVDGGGQVGIGTLSPSSALELKGDLTIQEPSYTNTATIKLESFGVGSGTLKFVAGGTNDTIAEFRDCCNPVFLIGGTSTASTFNYGLDVNDTLTAKDAFVLGDNGETGAINTSDWDISATGAITNATYEGLNISSTTGTLTIASGKTLTASNTLTFTGTDSTSFAFPGTSGTVCTTGSVCTGYQASGTYENALTFGNGLTRTVNAVALGGDLTANTTITQDTAETFTISNTGTGETAIDLTSTGDLNIKDNSTTFFSFQDNGTLAYTGGTGVTTQTAAGFTANSLTTGTAFQLTATALTTGSFFDINNGSSIFNVSQTAFTTSLPANFTAPGDVAVAYDLNFTNPTASYIKSDAPLSLVAGETFNSSNLVLQTYNSGTIVFQPAGQTALSVGYNSTGSYPFLNLGSKTATGDPAACTEGDLYYNDADDTIKICHESNVWESLDGGGALTLVSATNGLTGTSSASGLALYSGALSMLQGCSDGQVLKWVESTDTWDCSADSTGAGASTGDLQHAASFDTTEALTAVTASQVTLGTVSVTPSTATGDIYVTGFAEVRSSNATDQTFVLVIETTNNCTGTTVGTVSYTITSASSTTIHLGNVKVSGIVVDPGTSAQPFSLCASTATGSTNVLNWGIEALVIDSGADYAELYTSHDQTLTSGEVVSLDPTLKSGVKKSQKPYDQEVMGIVATEPGQVTGNVDKEGSKVVPIALAGRVPVKVSTENGVIKPGDYLTASSVPGVAMKATKPGKVIGQAMTEFSQPVEGLVLVFVSTSYADPSNFLANLKFDENGRLEKSSVQETEEIALTNKGFAVISATGQKVFKIDNSGNASLSGTLTVGRLVAGQIDGLEVITDQINLLKEKEASNSALIDKVHGQNNVLAESVASTSATVSNLSTKIDELLATYGLSQPIESSATASFSAQLALDQLRPTMTPNDLFIDGVATVSGQLTAQSLHIKDNVLIESFLSVLDVITTRRLIVSEVAQFMGEVIFRANVAIQGTLTLGPDSAGSAVISKNAEYIYIPFTTPYEEAPLVNATISLAGLPEDATPAQKAAYLKLENDILAGDFRYVVTDRGAKGFTIKLNKTAPFDLTFNWTAVLHSREETTGR